MRTVCPPYSVRSLRLANEDRVGSRAQKALAGMRWTKADHLRTDDQETVVDSARDTPSPRVETE